MQYKIGFFYLFFIFKVEHLVKASKRDFLFIFLIWVFD